MDVTPELTSLSVRVPMIYVPVSPKPLEILLVCDKPERSLGASRIWTTPGGGCEPGESPEDAARRELYEEAGIALGVNLLSLSQCLIFEGPPLPRFAHHKVYVFPVITRRKRSPVPRDSDIVDAKWFSLLELPSEHLEENPVPLAASTKPQLRALFRRNFCLQQLDAADTGEERIEEIIRVLRRRKKPAFAAA